MQYRGTDLIKDKRIYALWDNHNTYADIAMMEGITAKEAEKAKRRHYQRLIKGCPDRRKPEDTKITPMQRMRRIAFKTGVWADMTCKPRTERTFPCNK